MSPQSTDVQDCKDLLVVKVAIVNEFIQTIQLLS